MHITSKVANQDDAGALACLRDWTRPPVPKAGDRMELYIFEALYSQERIF